MVFVAVLLGVEVVLRNARAARGATNAINRRLALIARGISRDEVMVKLRRPTPTGRVPAAGPDRRARAAAREIPVKPGSGSAPARS